MGCTSSTPADSSSDAALLSQALSEPPKQDLLVCNDDVVCIATFKFLPYSKCMIHYWNANHSKLCCYDYDGEVRLLSREIRKVDTKEYFYVSPAGGKPGWMESYDLNIGMLYCKKTDSLVPSGKWKSLLATAKHRLSQNIVTVWRSGFGVSLLHSLEKGSKSDFYTESRQEFELLQSKTVAHRSQVYIFVRDLATLQKGWVAISDTNAHPFLDAATETVNLPLATPLPREYESSKTEKRPSAAPHLFPASSAAFANKSLPYWTTDDVEVWLKACDLPELQASLSGAGLDGRVLAEITEGYLRDELKISAEERKRILGLLAEEKHRASLVLAQARRNSFRKTDSFLRRQI